MLTKIKIMEVITIYKFIKVPRSIILNKSFGDKRVILFSSILFSNWNGIKYIDIVNYSQYSEFRGKSGVINQFKNLTTQFIDCGYLKFSNNHIYKNDINEQFGILYFNEFEKILELHAKYKKQGKRLNHAAILLLLVYIRLFMKKETKCYSDLLIRISNNIGLSVRSISSSIKFLEQLGIIHSEELPRYKTKDGCWHSNVRIFIDMKENGITAYNWEKEMTKSIWRIQTNFID